jgi:molybdopterin-guanine dinucleotide biosynthesis protein A
MGFDKAELRLGDARLADRAARLLSEVCDPAFEVGPGHSPLPTVREPVPGEGPLVALVVGAEVLRAAGAVGPIFLLAVDLPFVQAPLLEWLAARAGDATVVPTDSLGPVAPVTAPMR